MAGTRENGKRNELIRHGINSLQHAAKTKDVGWWPLAEFMVYPEVLQTEYILVSLLFCSVEYMQSEL